MWFNMFNWLYLISDINEFYSVQKPSKKALNIILFTCQMILLIFILVHFSLYWFSQGNSEDFHYWLAYPTSILLMISSTMFAVISSYYYKTLRYLSIKKALQIK